MNRYTVICSIGDGSFGGVSKATHNATGEVVAVKKMKQRFGSWDECLQLREVQSLRRLQHPNMIKLKEVIRENSELFLIFEYMEQNIYQIMRNRSEALGGSQSCGPFDDKEARSIVCQTLLGLQAMHRGGFFHRDLKPENLLTKGDIVKIADFGLAKEIRSRPPFTEYVSTRWYRAPEVILRSSHYNSPIDIWALGVIFAELYTGRPLFPGASDPDQLFKICSLLGSPSQMEWDEGHQLARKMGLKFPTISPTPLRSLVPQACPTAIDLMEQMLRFNPADRPTATACLQHPFFTGSDGHSSGELPSFGGLSSQTTGSVSATMYKGINSRQPHNPFHMAAGIPPITTAPPRSSGVQPSHMSPPGSGASTAGPTFLAHDALPSLGLQPHQHVRSSSHPELAPELSGPFGTGIPPPVSHFPSRTTPTDPLSNPPSALPSLNPPMPIREVAQPPPPSIHTHTTNRSRERQGPPSSLTGVTPPSLYGGANRGSNNSLLYGGLGLGGAAAIPPVSVQPRPRPEAHFLNPISGQSKPAPTKDFSSLGSVGTFATTSGTFGAPQHPSRPPPVGSYVPSWLQPQGTGMQTRPRPTGFGLGQPAPTYGRRGLAPVS